MKRAILTLLLLGSARAAIYPHIRYYDWQGPQTVPAGHTTIFYFRPLFAFDFTLDHNTGIFTAQNGYVPTNGDLVTPESSGTLPAGIDTIQNGSWPSYAVCSASGTPNGTFILREAASADNRAITAASWSSSGGGQATITIASTAGLTTTTPIYVWGVNPTGWNDLTSRVLPTSLTSTTVTFPMASDPGAYVSGGIILATFPGTAQVGTDQCYGPQVSPTDNGTGTHTFSIYQYATARPYVQGDPTGFPMGTTFSWQVPVSNLECLGTAPSTNGHYWSVGEGPLCARANVPSNATPGTYTTVWTVCDDLVCTNTKTLSWNIVVEAPPNISYTPPSSFTTLPGLSTVVSVMTDRSCPVNSASGFGCTNSGPADFCGTDMNNPMFGSMEPSVFGVLFYSWGLLYDNMKLYTGTSVYETGCFAAAETLVKNYVNNSLSPPGAAVPFFEFTEGLFRMGRVSGDASFTNAAKSLTNYGFYIFTPVPAFVSLRENSFGFEDTIAQYKYAGTTNPVWDNQRDGLYSLMYRTTESNASGARFPLQAFMYGGLATHSIIGDFQISQDSRAPELVKRAADTIWLNYNQTTHNIMNLEGPNGSPWCSNGAWFTAGDGNCGIWPPEYQNLQLMIVEAFYWYYAYTGDTTYRDRGDDMFQHALDIGGLSGKQSSEAYYTVFNAIAWRTGALTAFQWFGDPSTNPNGVYTGGSLITAGSVARK